MIGGTSLFGGRGKPLHSLLGGIVIAVVFNGLGLMGISSAGTDIATVIALIAAVMLAACGPPAIRHALASATVEPLAPGTPASGRPWCGLANFELGQFG